MTVVACRRYLCTSCGAVVMVVRADFVARVKACTRLLELGPAHVVVAFALLRGALPRGARS